MPKIARIIAYLAFAVAVVLFWVWAMPLSLGEPDCVTSGQGCPEPSERGRWLQFAKVYGSIPATVIAFIIYRMLVLRVLGNDKATARL